MLETDTAPLSAQDLQVVVVDRDGERTLLLTDGEQAIEISHEIGDDAKAAAALLRAAEVIRQHADGMGYRARMRTAGAT